MEHEDLTGQIIGAAIEVHRDKGPGFVESIYENAFCHELSLRGLAFERQKDLDVYYKGQLVGQQRLDVLVVGAIIVELKHLKELTDIHFATVRSYLKALGLKHGLLMNFGTMPLTVRRVLFEDRTLPAARYPLPDLQA